MHHFVTEMCTYVHISFTKWYIVGYATVALWDLCNRPINLVGIHLLTEFICDYVMEKHMHRGYFCGV